MKYKIYILTENRHHYINLYFVNCNSNLKINIVFDMRPYGQNEPREIEFEILVYSNIP